MHDHSIVTVYSGFADVVVLQMCTAKTISKLPTDDSIPTARNESLFFSLQSDADVIMKYFTTKKKDKKEIVFVRSGVAAGKTTMANHLSDIDYRFVFIGGPADYYNLDP